MLPLPDLQRLTADIKSGKCALVLGPEMFSVGPVPLQLFVKNALQEKFGAENALFNQRDGFFILRNPDDKPEMQDEVQFIYRDIRPDEGLLRRIVEIPFSLILSANPDTFLRDASFRLGLPNRFAWFDARKQEEFSMPDCDEADGPALRARIPLYYNLCGCTEKPSTLLLDYDDLFRLLEGMLGAPKLPEKLLARLKDTTSYLFLGFQFDRWHTQLLLRLLDVKNAARRFAIHSPQPDSDTQAFLLNQYRIKFLGDEEDLLGQIHDAFRQADLLRPVALAGTPAGLEITAFLQKGNLEKALARLLDAARGNAGLSDSATVVSGEFSRWNEEKNKGTLDSRDVVRQFNVLTDRVLQLSKHL